MIECVCFVVPLKGVGEVAANLTKHVCFRISVPLFIHIRSNHCNEHKYHVFIFNYVKKFEAQNSNKIQFFPKASDSRMDL